MFRVSLFVLAALLAAPALAQRSEPSPERLQVEAEQLFVRGMTRAYIGDLDGAVELYERALGLAPDDPAVLAALAEAHEARGDHTTALFFANRAVDRAPDEPSGYRLLAGLQLATGDTDAALATYERLVESQPTDIGALTALARIQQQSGRFPDALATYERVLDRVGENGAIRMRMLSIYERLGDDDGALRALEALVELDPTNEVLRGRLAERYRVRGDEARADAVAPDRAPEPNAPASSPEDAADALFEDGDWPAAADALARDLDADPLDPPAWARLVRAHLYAGDPTAALADADEALLLFPGQLDLVLATALAHADAGNTADARRAFADALTILDDERPDDAERDFLQAHLALLDGDLDAALDHARSAADAAPSNPAYLDALGRVHLARSEHDEAAEALAEAVAAGGRTVPTLERLGDAEAARGRTDEARRRWQAALEIAPGRSSLRNKLGDAP